MRTSFRSPSPPSSFKYNSFLQLETLFRQGIICVGVPNLKGTNIPPFSLEEICEVGTQFLAYDLDLLRKAVGAGKLNVYGCQDE